MQRRENARLVKPLGAVNNAVPHGALQVIILDHIGGCVERGTPFHIGRNGIAGFYQVVEFTSPVVGEQAGVRFRDHRREAEILGMIGHDKKIQGPDKLRPCAHRCPDLLAPGKSICLVGAEDIADHAGVGGIGGVEMRVAPKDAVRIGLIEKRRVMPGAQCHVVRVDGNVTQVVLSEGRPGPQRRDTKPEDHFLHFRTPPVPRRPSIAMLPATLCVDC